MLYLKPDGTFGDTHEPYEFDPYEMVDNYFDSNEAYDIYEDNSRVDFYDDTYEMYDEAEPEDFYKSAIEFAQDILDRTLTQDEEEEYLELLKEQYLKHYQQKLEDWLVEKTADDYDSGPDYDDYGD